MGWLKSGGSTQVKDMIIHYFSLPCPSPHPHHHRQPGIGQPGSWRWKNVPLTALYENISLWKHVVIRCYMLERLVNCTVHSIVSVFAAWHEMGAESVSYIQQWLSAVITLSTLQLYGMYCNQLPRHSIYIVFEVIFSCSFFILMLCFIGNKTGLSYVTLQRVRSVLF